ncbi:hypothetical protein BLJ79_22130 [Arthrobacter sp. UCD-GKA]|nr:hypothetical protein BLJ79_22130 [Arthrobacter sp. UCD-GKA]
MPSYQSSRFVQLLALDYGGVSMARITSFCFRQLAWLGAVAGAPSLCLLGFFAESVQVSVDLRWWEMVCIVF